jgi:hypothetical protein
VSRAASAAAKGALGRSETARSSPARGREVYLIEGGRRREIPDIQTFKALGLDPHKMVTVSDDELARIPLGEPLPRR